MERQKWLYVALFVLTMVTLSWFIIIWQSGGLADGGGAQSPPHLAQSPTDAAKVLRDWMASNWADDAVITATTLMLSRHNPTEHGWTFQAYSAQRNRLLVVVVEGQDIQVLRDIAALYRPTALPAAAWNQDIQNILKVWWRKGGATAWNAPSTSTVTMHLAIREDGVPAWQLTLERNKGSHELQNSLEYWEIRADTAVLLEQSSTGGQ